MFRILILLVSIACSNSTAKNLNENRSTKFNSIQEILEDCLNKYQEAKLEVEKLKEQTEIGKTWKEFNFYISDKVKLIKDRIKNGEKYPFYTYRIGKITYLNSCFIFFFSNDQEFFNFCIETFNEEDRNTFFLSIIELLNMHFKLYDNKSGLYIIKKCLEKGISLDPLKILRKIIYYDDTSLIKILLDEYEIDIDSVKVDKNTKVSYSLLQLCIKFQLNNIAKYLIENEANLELSGTTYSTIRIAAIKGNLEIFKILLGKGLKPSSSDEDKKTLLDSLKREKKIRKKTIKQSNEKIELKKEMETQAKNYEEIINIIKSDLF